ncbi:MULTISPECIES: replication initiator protein A [Gluconobacter]|nr:MULTISPECIES: replication initiator protein A [Gluconobacter]MBS1064273.1 replication initiator protein A [Gluconobacter wancherniae]
MFLSEFNIQLVLEEYLMGIEKDPSSKTFRSAPSDQEQGDFFVPGLYDLATKDNRGVMDVAVFRLSKKDKRANDVMIHHLPDGYVRITSGPDGMASIWDYDIILMGISYLTEAMNKYRSGLGEKPGRIFSPQVSDILKFCRQSDGGRQYEAVESALRRLKQTSLEIVRGEKKTRGGRTIRETTGSGLINDYKTISYADTGRVMAVEIELPNWLYSAVVESENPEVLTVHPDYFLLKPGLGRFLYRLARVAAGKNEAKWSFRLIYERSGSQGTFKRCSYELREFVKRNDLPEYDLHEESGRDGPLLIMRYRSEKQHSSLGS